jgi:hypothetical protein
VAFLSGSLKVRPSTIIIPPTSWALFLVLS